MLRSRSMFPVSLLLVGPPSWSMSPIYADTSDGQATRVLVNRPSLKRLVESTFLAMSVSPVLSLESRCIMMVEHYRNLYALSSRSEAPAEHSRLDCQSLAPIRGQRQWHGDRVRSRGTLRPSPHRSFSRGGSPQESSVGHSQPIAGSSSPPRFDSRVTSDHQERSYPQRIVQAALFLYERCLHLYCRTSSHGSRLFGSACTYAPRLCRILWLTISPQGIISNSGEGGDDGDITLIEDLVKKSITGNCLILLALTMKGESSLPAHPSGSDD